MTFSWVKFDKTGKFFPSFVYPKKWSPNKKIIFAQFMTQKGVLSKRKHPVYKKLQEVTSSDEERDKLKPKEYVKGLMIFNAKHGTSFI